MNRPVLDSEQQGVFGRVASWLKGNVDVATKPVPANIAVSHEIFGPVEVDCDGIERSDGCFELSRKNHAWWIGKIPKKKEERGDCIYSPEFIRASLEVLFKNLRRGEVAQIVMAPSFSKYFNGTADLDRGLSNEEAIAFIMKIVKEKFPEYFSSIDINCVETIPLHEDLFRKLEASFDVDKGLVDHEKAFGVSEKDSNNPEFNLSINPTSLNIARFLYGASKENQSLFQFFRHAMPDKIRPDFEDEPCSRDYYALAEVSVRLAEILSGRCVHGGADRQGKYDDFIEDMVVAANPKHGKQVRKKATLVGLEPLIELLKGKRFETLHLDTCKNPYKMQIERKVARTRLALAGVTAALTVILPKIGVDVASELRRRDNVNHGREMVMKMVEQVLNGRCLTQDHCKFGGSPEAPFRWILNECLYQIFIRYSVSRDQIFELENSLLVFVLSHQEFLSRIGDDNSSLIEFVDKFMNDPVTRIKLAEIGINEVKIYKKLESHNDELVKIAKGSASKKIPDDEDDCPANMVQDLGLFSPSNTSSWNRYNLGVCYGGNGNVLVAQEDYSYGTFVNSDSSWSDDVKRWFNETFYTPKMPFSAKLVQDKVAKEYVDTMRKAEMTKIPDRMKDSLMDICDSSHTGRLSNFDFSEASSAPEYVNKKGVHVFKDPFDGEEWDLAMSGDCQKFGEKLFCENFVIAKKAGETNFTFVRAQEFAQKYIGVMHSHWKYDTECKKPESSKK